MKYLLFLGPIAIATLWFIDGFQNKNLFVQATYGWFRPSSDSVNFTLLILFIATTVFAILTSRLSQRIIRLYSLVLFSFVASYVLFIVIEPSANGAELSGLILSLLYGFGKYGILIISFVAIVLSLKKHIVEDAR